MRPLVFLLEEPSAQDALEGILPRILPPDASLRFLVFEGKQDLEKRLSRTLRAWQQPDAQFVVLRDQDAGDCRIIKARLLDLCRKADKEKQSVVRIACRELESWFVGDWKAVASAYGMTKLTDLQRKAMYQEPDRLANPVAELRKYLPTYQKRDGARRIGPHLNPECNSSRSFMAFTRAIKRLISEDPV